MQTRSGEVRRGPGEAAPPSKAAAVSPWPHVSAAAVTHVITGKCELGALGSVRPDTPRRQRENGVQ